MIRHGTKAARALRNSQLNPSRTTKMVNQVLVFGFVMLIGTSCKFILFFISEIKLNFSDINNTFKYFDPAH